MATRPKNSDEVWVADIERKAEGALWEETPPVAEQLADHFARLGLTDTTR